MTITRNRAVLLIYCPDAIGIIASVTDFLHKNKGNIYNLAQHVDIERDAFFLRVEWELADFIIPNDKIAEYFQTLVASTFEMVFELYFTDKKPRMAIFVSKMPHCLYDLLARAKDEWEIEIPLIISNHKDLEPIANQFGIDFHYFPITKENKEAQEEAELALLKEYKVDMIVLARYMQVLSQTVIDHYPSSIINIHHSFLPAFPGAKPYHAAHEHGVKIIGATSHYVSAELDAGPIIEQDVAKVSHKESVNDLVRKGRDLEKLVLSRAIWHHLQRNILVYENRTVVFD